jgi:hypothetical protein
VVELFSKKLWLMHVLTLIVVELHGGEIIGDVV